MDQLETPFGSYKLQRFPLQKDEPLRAWDAADELLLKHIAVHNLAKTPTLIVNDLFGALTVNLHKFTSTHWSDSFVSHLAAEKNYSSNQLVKKFQILASTKAPKGSFNLVLLKTPKSNALLEYQLNIINRLATKETILIAAGMNKYIHSSTLNVFEKIIGKTTTSLAEKKARLIFSQFSKPGINTESDPLPSQFNPELDLQLVNQANVFSKDKLDQGARLMIEQFDRLPVAKHVVDLGCGDGILGIMAKRKQANIKLSFIDESYMAIASAESNYRQHYPDNDAEFIVADCLTNIELEKPDLILCNPPFHLHHSISDNIAWRMFSQSHSALAKGGQLWVVGNRHLNYHLKMKRLFSNYENIAGNKKFAIICSQK